MTLGLYAGIGLEDRPEESEDELSSNDLDSDCNDFDNDDCDDWGDDGADD